MQTPNRFVIKVAGTFLTVLLAIGGAALLSILGLARSAAEREAVARDQIEDLVLAERLRAASDAMASASRGYLLTGNGEFLRRYADSVADFEKGMSSLRSERTAPGLLDEIQRAADELTDAHRKLMATASSGAPPHEVSRDFELDAVPARRHLAEAIARLVHELEQRMRRGEASTQAATRNAVIGALSLIAAAVLASAALAGLTSRYLGATYRKEAEAVRAAERALAARDEVLGIVAHDLRSPLSAIAMKAGVVRRSTAEEKTRKHASAIESVSRRMDLLITGLLDSASIESGTLTVRPSPCDVDEVLRDALRELTSLAEVRSIRLEAHVPEGGLAVLADRPRLIQVLSNIIGNAIKFSLEGGCVDISVERVEADVRFAVADTGPGIGQGNIEHVFDRFWKSDTGGKRGAGLGLYIVRGIVEAHGGRVWLKSSLGSGTTFFFTLPFTQLVPARPDEAPPAQTAH